MGHISDKTARCQGYCPGPVTDANCLRFTRKNEELFAFMKGCRMNRQQLEWPPQQGRQFKWPPQRPLSSPQPIQMQPQQHQFEWSPPQQLQPQPIQLQEQLQKQRKPRGKRLRRWFVCLSIVTLIAVVFSSQANGSFGAVTADAMRAVLGPTITAQIESWFLGVSDTVHQAQSHLSGRHVDPPWTVQSLPIAPASALPTSTTLAPMPLVPVVPVIRPSLPGEGVWITEGYAAPPFNFPLDAKTFLRPDPVRPYAIVTLLQFDMRFIRLHMVAGTSEPGGPRGVPGPGVIPVPDQKGTALLAAFNGGFKYADGQYGMQANGTVYVPPQPSAATIAVTNEGQIILGKWGVDPHLNSGNSDLVAWRQNAALLIDHGVINSLANDGAAWGGTILNRTYTWRSGIGITAQGTLLYAAGSSLSALTLGQALHAAGAVMAMQTDINPFWVRAFLYNRNSTGTFQITKLNPGMQGSGTEYLYGTVRDFFYLTRFLPNLPTKSGTKKTL